MVIKKALKDINISADRIMLQSTEGYWGDSGTYELGYTLGSIYGDGGIYYSNKNKNPLNVRMKFWDESPEFLDFVRTTVDKVSTDFNIDFRNEREYEYRKNTINEFNITANGSKKYLELVNIKDKSSFPEYLYTASRETVKGFIDRKSVV